MNKNNILIETCLNCGKSIKYTKDDVCTDDFGEYIVCPDCGASSDVNNVSCETNLNEAIITKQDRPLYDSVEDIVDDACELDVGDHIEKHYSLKDYGDIIIFTISKVKEDTFEITYRLWSESNNDIEFTHEDIDILDLDTELVNIIKATISDLNTPVPQKDLNEAINDGADKLLYNSVENIADDICNMNPGEDAQYEYNSDITFSVYRDEDEFSDLFNIYVIYKGQILDELDTGDVHLSDLDTTLVNLIENIENSNMETTEYTITFNDGELYNEYGGEFTSEDKDEADELFNKIKSDGKLDQVNQYYAKTWIDNDGDFIEGDVDVYYTEGDILEESNEAKDILKNITLEDEIDEWKIYDAEIDTELGKDLINSFEDYEDDDGNVINHIRIDYNTETGNYIVNYVDNNGRFNEISYKLTNNELAKLNEGKNMDKRNNCIAESADELKDKIINAIMFYEKCDKDAALKIYNENRYKFYPGVKNDTQLGKAFIEEKGGILEALPDKYDLEYYIDKDDLIRNLKEDEYDFEEIAKEHFNVDDIDDVAYFEYQDFERDYFDNKADEIIDDAWMNHYADDIEEYFDYSQYASDYKYGSYYYNYNKDGAIAVFDENVNELEESKRCTLKESDSYKDLVSAGESLWRDGATIYETNVNGIYDCNTDGHGGYLVDASKFPELAKYGEKTSIDNIVGFEEDYEALKVIWVVPEVLSDRQANNDFIKNLTIDQVTKYDSNDDFKNEFPERRTVQKTEKCESTEYVSKYDELDDLLDRFASDEEQKIELYNAFNDTEMVDFDDDIYVDWLDSMIYDNYDELRDYLDELADTDDWEFSKITESEKAECENKSSKAESVTYDTNKHENVSSNNIVNRLFSILGSYTHIIPDEWNSATREERDNMVRGGLEEFYKDNKADIDNNWKDLYDLLEANNYHTENRILYEIIKNNKDKVNESKEACDKYIDEISKASTKDGLIDIVKKMWNDDSNIEDNELADIVIDVVIPKMEKDFGIKITDKVNMDAYEYFVRNFLDDEKLDESKNLNERGLTRAERHNRNMERIFNNYNAQLDRMADYLKQNGFSDEEISELRKNTGLGASALPDKAKEVADKNGPNEWHNLCYGVTESKESDNKLEETETDNAKELQEARRKVDSVTEYTITFSDGELYDEYGGEFISEDKDEADELFDSIKAENKLDQVEQYYAKTWIWEGSDYSEDDVKVYYTKGDSINESCKQKARKKIEKVNKDNIEINKAIGSPRKGKNPERIRAAGYEVDKYGNVTNPKTGKRIHPTYGIYTQDEKEKIDFKGMLDTDYASKPVKGGMHSYDTKKYNLPKSLKVGKFRDDLGSDYDIYNIDDLDKQYSISGSVLKRNSISQNINDYKDMKTDIRDAKNTVRNYDIDIQRAKNDIEDAKEKIKDTNIKKKAAQKDVRNLEKQKDKFMDKVRAEHNKNNEENETEDLQEARRNPKVNTINKGNNKMDFSNTKRNKFRSVDQANRNFYRDLQGNSAKGSGTWEENPNEKSNEYRINKNEIARNKDLINLGKNLNTDDTSLKDTVAEINQELVKKNQDLEDRNKEIIADKNKKKKESKELTEEKQWAYKFDNTIRSAINSHDVVGIINAIRNNCEAIQKADQIDDTTKAKFESYIDFYDEEFGWIVDDISDDSSKAYEYDDYMNKALSDLYDLCDETNVFIELM